MSQPLVMMGAMSRAKIVHVCSECGTTHAKWAGRCAGCGDWNTLVEDVEVENTTAPVAASTRPGPTRIGDVGTEHGHPVTTSIPELDRVLGGGLVAGSVTLLGGEPGIGKSTLLLQLLAAWSGPTLYVTAEESAQQVKRRAERLGATRDDLWLHAETSLAHILDAIDRIRPELVVIDSIQTVSDPTLGSLPGSVAQVRGCAQRLVNEAKERNVSIMLVGHVTKEGGLAGPRVLEHVVDTVLQFEGDRHHALRLLRARRSTGSDRPTNSACSRWRPPGSWASPIHPRCSSPTVAPASPAPRWYRPWRANGRSWSKCRHWQIRAFRECPLGAAPWASMAPDSRC